MENQQVWNKLDNEHYKSIELGFDGHLTQEFYKKLASVKKVRRKLKFQLLWYIVFIFGYSLLFCHLSISSMPIYTTIAFVFFGILMIIAIIKNLLIWHEITKIRNKRFKDYYEKINKQS